MTFRVGDGQRRMDIIRRSRDDGLNNRFFNVLKGTSHMATKNDDWVIDIQDVSKTYPGKVRALRGISMRVRRGEIFGLLGPNGAGKSTLVKILMTIVRPTHCEGKLLGQAVGNRDSLKRVGFLPEHLQFPDYLTGDQALDFYAALSHVPRNDRRERADKLLEQVGMTDWRTKRIKTYSKGMKQRTGLAQALMNDPDLILLDEPTDGVDPVGRRDIRKILMDLKAQGKTVFINSHLLSELEMVCDRVAILSKGNVVAQGSIEELTKASRRYEIKLASKLPKNTPLEELLKKVEAKTDQTEQSAEIMVPNDDTAAVQPVIDALRQAGAQIESLRPVRQSLEDLFMQAVEDAEGKSPTPGAAVQRASKGENH